MLKTRSSTKLESQVMKQYRNLLKQIAGILRNTRLYSIRSLLIIAKGAPLKNGTKFLSKTYRRASSKMNTDILTNISKIIERDSKSTTYKFALLRGVIDIIQENSPYIKVNQQRVEIPLGLM